MIVGLAATSRGEVVRGRGADVNGASPGAAPTAPTSAARRRSLRRGVDPARTNDFVGDTSGATADQLVTMVNATLRMRGFVDYDRSFAVAQDAHGMLDELEKLLDAGAAGVVRPALLRALSRLRTIMERADDSSGSISDACQRAADLYARSCRAGHPDQVKLARWLVWFRDESPGWPEVTVSDFVDAFDDTALVAYRLGVAGLEQKHDGRDHSDRTELRRMRLELADHDEDVDVAVKVLSEEDRPQYAAIVDRLRMAGRFDEVTTWVDRAVEAGAVSRRMMPGGRSHWLDPDEVAGEYLAQDRVKDAIEVFRADLRRYRDVDHFRALMSFAERIGCEPGTRTWAIQMLRERAAGRLRSSGPPSTRRCGWRMPRATTTSQRGSASSATCPSRRPVRSGSSRRTSPRSGRPVLGAGP